MTCSLLAGPNGFAEPFVHIIARVYVFIKGLAGSIILYGSLPLFRSTFNLSGSKYQTYSTIAMLPWTMKPIVGAIVDVFPLGGYRKKNYAIIALVFGFVSLFALVFNTTVVFTTFLLFFASFSIMTVDLIYEGEYSSIMAFKGGSAGMPAFVWSCIMIGSIFGAILVGPLGDNGDIRYAYPIAALCTIQLIHSLISKPEDSFANDRVLFKKDNINLSEQMIQYDDDESRGTVSYRINTSISTREWVLCILMAGVSVLLMIMLFTGIDYPWTTFAAATVCIFILHAYAYFTFHNTSCSKREQKRQDQLWTYNLFMFLVEALYVNISGAQDFWYTADESCVPNGPAFSLSLYTTAVTIMSALAGIIASCLYTRTMMKWTFRSALQTAIVFQAMSAFTDITIAKRWNQTHLHISDEVFFLFGDAVISPVASMLKLIPMAILTSKIVEHGKETMTYSLLAGFQNMGMVFSKIFGLALMQSFGIKTIAPHCAFEFYPALIFCAHMIIPMLSFTLAYLMMPDTKQQI